MERLTLESPQRLSRREVLKAALITAASIGVSQIIPNGSQKSEGEGIAPKAANLPTVGHDVVLVPSEHKEGTSAKIGSFASESHSPILREKKSQFPVSEIKANIETQERHSFLSSEAFQEIISRNNILDSGLIYPGQVLFLPDGSAYPIERGDTLSQLSDSFADLVCEEKRDWFRGTLWYQGEKVVGFIYETQEGDTLEMVIQNTGCDLICPTKEELVEKNCLVDDQSLEPGTMLKVPCIYKVQEGDTPELAAKRVELPVPALMGLNRSYNFFTLKDYEQRGGVEVFFPVGSRLGIPEIGQIENNTLSEHIVVDEEFEARDKEDIEWQIASIGQGIQILGKYLPNFSQIGNALGKYGDLRIYRMDPSDDVGSAAEEKGACYWPYAYAERGGSLKPGIYLSEKYINECRETYYCGFALTHELSHYIQEYLGEAYEEFSLSYLVESSILNAYISWLVKLR